MILNRQRTVRIPLASLEAFLRRVRRELRLRGREVSICFVTDAAIARWNQNYRGKRGPTDVLSFPADASGGTFLGDIAISPAAARRNARRFGRSLHDELRILILHGALHLMGYDHEADEGEMERLERRLRRRLGLERPDTGRKD